MTDITVYKPSTVVVRREKNGNYTIVKPAWMSISAINVTQPGSVSVALMGQQINIPMDE